MSMDFSRTSNNVMIRWVWLGLGWLSLLAGAIGVLLPVLPTTPFVLFAAFAFGKGSPRLRATLLRHRTFGPIIRDWEANGTIDPRYKRMAYSLMLVAFLASVLAGVKPFVLVVQAICMGAAALYVFTRPIPAHWPDAAQDVR